MDCGGPRHCHKPRFDVRLAPTQSPYIAVLVNGHLESALDSLSVILMCWSSVILNLL